MTLTTESDGEKEGLLDRGGTRERTIRDSWLDTLSTQCSLFLLCCFPASEARTFPSDALSLILLYYPFLKTNTPKSQPNGDGENGMKNGTSTPSLPSSLVLGDGNLAESPPRAASPHPPTPPPLPPSLQPPLAFGAVARRVARAVSSRRSAAMPWLERVLAESKKMGTPILLPHVVRDALRAVEAEAEGGGFSSEGKEEEEEEEQGKADLKLVLGTCQEAVACSACVGLALRPSVGVWVFVRLCSASLRVEELSVRQWLVMKELAVGARLPSPSGELLLGGPVEVNLAPFAHNLPRVSRAKAIGDGLRHLNRHLTSRVLSVAAAARSSIAVKDGGGVFDDDGGGGIDGGGGLFSRRSPSSSSSSSSAPPSPLVDFLRDLDIDGLRIMLGDASPTDEDALAALLARAEAFLGEQDPEAPTGIGSPLAASLQQMGFEPGWGATAGRALETMEQLSEILDAPAADVFESFLGE